MLSVPESPIISPLERDKRAVQERLKVLERLPTDESRSLVLISAVDYSTQSGLLQYLVPSIGSLLKASGGGVHLDIVIGLDGYNPQELLTFLQHAFTAVDVVILQRGSLLTNASSNAHRVLLIDQHTAGKSQFSGSVADHLTSHGKVATLAAVADVLLASAKQGYVLPICTVMADQESHFIAAPAYGASDFDSTSQILKLVQDFMARNTDFLATRSFNTVFSDERVSEKIVRTPDFSQPPSLHHILNSLAHRSGLRGSGYVADTKKLLAILEVIAQNHPTLKGEDTMIELLARALGYKIEMSVVSTTNATPDAFSTSQDGSPLWLAQMIRWMEGTMGVAEVYQDLAMQQSVLERGLAVLCKSYGFVIAVCYFIKLSLETSEKCEKSRRLQQAIRHVLQFGTNRQKILSAAPHHTTTSTEVAQWDSPVGDA